MLLINSIAAQETFKVMFYNLLNYPTEDTFPNRINDLGVILSDYQPDLFMVCELNNAAGAAQILNVLQNNVSTDFQMAIFQTNTSDDSGSDQNDLQNLIFYDSSKFILQSQSIVTTIFRDFNIYKLRLNTTDQNTNPIEFDAIVCHLKASSGLDNEALRLEMVEDLTAHLNSYPSDSKVILGGDLNLYNSSEDAFQELTDFNNNIWFVDPVNRIGDWHTNSSFLDVFTQSTRTQSGLGGASGGFDDRFDFIMTTQNLMSDPDLSYITNSYKAYGNNNNTNCFNEAINSSDCSGSDYSLQIRNALYNFSDHLPVTLELQTNATLSINESTIQNGIEFVGGNIINNYLHLKINPSAHIDSPINIYNALGQLVKSFDIGKTNTNELKEDLNYLTNGIYYLTVSGNYNATLKFVKSN